MRVQNKISAPVNIYDGVVERCSDIWTAGIKGWIYRAL